MHQLFFILFVAMFLDYNQDWPDGFMVLCPGAPEGSLAVVLVFKASQKTGPPLKVSLDRLGEVGKRTCHPWKQDIGLSPTPQWLLFIFIDLLNLNENKIISTITFQVSATLMRCGKELHFRNTVVVK